MRSHESIAGRRQLGRLSLRSPHLVVEPLAPALDLHASFAQLAARPCQLGPRAGHTDLIDAQRLEGLTASEERRPTSLEARFDVLQQAGVGGLTLASLCERSELVRPLA